MGSSAFEIILVPVLWGTFQGIAAGTALLILWDALVALVGWLAYAIRSVAAPARAARVAPRRPDAGVWERAGRPAVRDGRLWGLHG